jgi:hypothetical protein
MASQSWSSFFAMIKDLNLQSLAWLSDCKGWPTDPKILKPFVDTPGRSTRTPLLSNEIPWNGRTGNIYSITSTRLLNSTAAFVRKPTPAETFGVSSF